MRIDVLTIFPEVFHPILGSSIVKRAITKGVIRVQVHDLRKWSRDKHRKVDDRPYGGGPGMVMKPEPFFEAVEELKRAYSVQGTGYRKSPRTTNHEPRTKTPQPHVILMSPQGEPLTQRKLEALAKKKWLIVLCGHYEGVDERIHLGLAQEEISIGDYVLTCGELPAMVLIDGVTRLLPGSLGKISSTREESFKKNLLEYPQYTRPRRYRGMQVPEVLISGDHEEVTRWRRLQAEHRTMRKRPDLSNGSSNCSD